MDPPNKCCILEERTEVIVSPKMRQCAAKLPRSVAKSAEQKLNESNTEITNCDQSPNKETLTDMQQKEINNGVLSQTYNRLKSWFGGIFENECSSSYQEPQLSFLENDLSCSLRVQPYGEVSETLQTLGDEDKNQDRYTLDLDKQSTNVFIAKDTLQKHIKCSEVPGSFMGYISRLLSPKDNEELAKSRMEREDRQKDLAKSKLDEEDNVLKFPVRVVVYDNDHLLQSHGQELKDQIDADTTKFPLVFKEEWGVLLDHIVIHDLLRRQLRLEVTGKVKLESIKESDKLKKDCSVVAHPLFEVVSHYFSGHIVYVTCHHDMSWESH